MILNKQDMSRMPSKFSGDVLSKQICIITDISGLINSSSFEGDALCDPKYTAIINVFITTIRLHFHFYI
jgi:hypothetical protein